MVNKIFKALSDPTRIKIIESIGKKELCACELPEKVNRAQPTVSLHLKTLEEAGLLKSRRDGRMILYSIADDKVLDLIDVAKKMSR